MKMNREELIESLEDIRKTQGEEAYHKARNSIALMLVGTEKGRTFLRETFADLDVEALSKEAANKKVSSDEDLFNMLQMQVPNLKTQAQFEAYRLAFDALSYLADASFAGNFEAADKCQEALNLALSAIRQASLIAARAETIPVEERGPEVAEMLKPPAAPVAEDQRKLLSELEAITDAKTLATWYQEARSRMERVTEQPFRNELFDAIRAKQQALST